VGPRLARKGLLLAVVVVVMAACRPLYLPLVPEPPPYEPGVRVATFSAQLGAAQRPLLELTLADVSAAGWLAVQWMAPSGRQVASGSVWLTPEEPAARFVLPEDVALTPGEWRAVVSFGSTLLRQFTFVIE
jgi:hypothetical protein